MYEEIGRLEFVKGGGGGLSAKQNVKLQTRAITEFMYTTYSLCYNLHFQAKGSLNTSKV